MEWSYRLELKIQRDGEYLNIGLVGRLDATTSPILETALLTQTEGVKSITFDLDGLQYISSAGLRLMLIAAKKIRLYGTPLLINVSEDLMDIFKMSGFDEILNLQKKG